MSKQSDQHVENARQHLGKGEFENAISEYTKAIEIDDQPLTHTFRAIVYGVILGMPMQYADEKIPYARAALPDFDIAIKFYKDGGRVPNFNTGLEGFYFQRAMTHIYLGNAQKAVDDLSSAIDLDPGNASFRSQLGSVYLDQLNNPAKAVDCFMAAISLNQSADYFLFLAWCFIDLGDIEKAMALIHKAAVLDMNSLDADRNNDFKTRQWRIIRSTYTPYANRHR